MANIIFDYVNKTVDYVEKNLIPICELLILLMSTILILKVTLYGHLEKNLEFLRQGSEEHRRVVPMLSGVISFD